MKEDNTPHRLNPVDAGPRPPFSAQREKGAVESTDSLEPAPDHGEKSYMGRGRLKGCVALVVGGDSGIGRAISLAYAREGADVAFTYHQHESDARTTADLLCDHEGTRHRIYQLDQSNKEDCQEVIEQVIRDLGRLDILVNNAGFQKTYQDLNEIEVEEFEATFQTNVFGTFYLSRFALDRMESGGCIINTSSIQAFDPSAYLLPYAASKAAIANMTKSLAVFAADRGVRVNAVAPGPVWTPLIPATMPASKVENFGSNTLLGRPAQPIEIASVYVFLASPEARYVSGEVYPITGGRQQM